MQTVWGTRCKVWMVLVSILWHCSEMVGWAEENSDVDNLDFTWEMIIFGKFSWTAVCSEGWTSIDPWTIVFLPSACLVWNSACVCQSSVGVSGRYPLCWELVLAGTPSELEPKNKGHNWYMYTHVNCGCVVMQCRQLMSLPNFLGELCQNHPLNMVSFSIYASVATNCLPALRIWSQDVMSWWYWYTNWLHEGRAVLHCIDC